MNCQEGMENMQRQLDGDLDDHESEALMSHMRHCQQCAAMFERLQLLSADLENLPKVMPPFSLVDAIMPRIAELPNANLANAAESSESSSSFPSRTTRTVPVKRWKDRVSLRVLSGVVAASLVVGLFITTYKPFGSGSAEDSASLAADMSKSFAADNESSGAADSSAFKKSDVGDDSQLKEALEVSPSSVSEPESKQPAEEPQPDARKAPDAAPPKEESPPKSSSSDKGYNIDSKPTSSRNGEVKLGGNVSPDKGKAPNYNYDIQSGSDDKAAGSSNSSESGNASNNNTGDTKPGGLKSADEGEIQEQTGGNAAGQNPSLQPTQQVQEVLSPNGSYRASIIHNQVNINTVENNTTLFISEPSAQGFGSIVWAADSKTVTYEVITEQGVQTFVVDPEAGTATLVQPK